MLLEDLCAHAVKIMHVQYAYVLRSENNTLLDFKKWALQSIYINRAIVYIMCSDTFKGAIARVCAHTKTYKELVETSYHGHIKAQPLLETANFTEGREMREPEPAALCIALCASWVWLLNTSC